MSEPMKPSASFDLRLTDHFHFTCLRNLMICNNRKVLTIIGRLWRNKREGFQGEVGFERL
jgi:hypothetical protein